MRQQVHDQGDNADAEDELECEDRAAGSDGDQPTSPGPGPPDVLETGPVPGGPLGHNVPLRVCGERWSTCAPQLGHVGVLACGRGGRRSAAPGRTGHWLAGAFQSRSWTMTPLGSVTWNARSPQGSSRSGMVMLTPSPSRRASSPLRDTADAGICTG